MNASLNASIQATINEKKKSLQKNITRFMEIDLSSLDKLNQQNITPYPNNESFATKISEPSNNCYLLSFNTPLNKV